MKQTNTMKKGCEVLEGRILIIEDDKVIGELEKDYLEANNFYVENCFDGKSGLTAALCGDFDLILLDLMLPEMDGFEVCRRIRAKKDIPILMVTAKQEDVDLIHAFGNGADDYITKPFSLSQLVARIGAHISRYKRLTEHGKNETPEQIVCGGLRINKSSRRVFVDDKEIILTNKEFDLLYYLAANPNVVFSKDVLFDKIWGFDSIGETSTVTVHINRIREKIEDDSSSPKYIETVWGAGYRFKISE